MPNIRYRTYKTSINLFFFRYYGTSKVYAIPEGKSTILPGLKYSVATIFFGWWSGLLPWIWYRNISNSLTALHVNFTGGEDYTKVISDMEYDEKTLWVFGNLQRETSALVSVETAAVLVELQDNFIATEPAQDNISSLAEDLQKINLNVPETALSDFIDTYKRYDNRELN
jgi:hypothetical protein